MSNITPIRPDVPDMAVVIDSIPPPFVTLGNRKLHLLVDDMNVATNALVVHFLGLLQNVVDEVAQARQLADEAGCSTVLTALDRVIAIVDKEL